MPRNRYVEGVRAFFKRLLPEPLFVGTVRFKRAFMREPHEVRDFALYRKLSIGPEIFWPARLREWCISAGPAGAR
jgi:hypothetical protein